MERTMYGVIPIIPTDLLFTDLVVDLWVSGIDTIINISNEEK